MAMVYILANDSACTHKIGLTHSGGSRIDIAPNVWLYGMHVAHVGHAKAYVKQQCAAAGITAEVFPMLKSTKTVSTVAMTALTAYLGQAPADATAATIIEAVFAKTGDPWFDPDGAD